MATCSIFANPIIDTEESAIALADAYDKFMDEQAKKPEKSQQRTIDPIASETFAKVLARVRDAK